MVLVAGASSASAALALPPPLTATFASAVLAPTPAAPRIPHNPIIPAATTALVASYPNALVPPPAPTPIPLPSFDAIVPESSGFLQATAAADWPIVRLSGL